MQSTLLSRKIKYLLIALSVITISVYTVVYAPVTDALVKNVSPTAKVSFTFDDGLSSTYTQAAPVLAKYGYSGTTYIITRCAGMTTSPNTCQANNDASYMSWDQIHQLQDNYGWEIGSHTATHPYLATFDVDDQPLPISSTQMVQELVQSKNELLAQGFQAPSFATPYGDYNMETLAEISKYYQSQRGFGDVGYNQWPYSDYYVRVEQVQGGVSTKTVKSYIDQAAANNQWLILVFHDVKTRASNQPYDYEYSTKNFDTVASYVKTKNLPVVNISDGFVSSDENLLPNSSFNNGITDGWKTDSPDYIKWDNGNNGSYPDSNSSINLKSDSVNRHLFSPLVNVDSSVNYMLKSFVNVKSINSGALGFFIDEYDASGNWISGQYKVSEGSVFVESLNFAYKPTSNNVKKASLQIIVQGGSGINAYIDNIQWFGLNDAVILPPPPPPAPGPEPLNLVANGQFDTGLADGWSTDSPSNITSDSTGNGSTVSPQNSIKLVAKQTGNSHLFAPSVNVSSAKVYNISCWINIKQILTGEIGYYVDEYDASGNWISGQYISSVNTLGISNVNLTYQPSSSSVASASLQVIVVGGSNIEAYIDNIVFSELN